MSKMPSSGKEWVSLAKQNGLEVQNGKGSHVKIVAPEGRGYMIVPMHRELHKGLNHAIWKWFKALGIISLLVIGILAFLK